MNECQTWAKESFYFYATRGIDGLRETERMPFIMHSWDRSQGQQYLKRSYKSLCKIDGKTSCVMFC